MICDDICTSKFGNFDKILKIDQLSNVRQLANQLMNSQLRLAQWHTIKKTENQKTRKADSRKEKKQKSRKAKKKKAKKKKRKKKKIKKSKN